MLSRPTTPYARHCPHHTALILSTELSGDEALVPIPDCHRKKVLPLTPCGEIRLWGTCDRPQGKPPPLPTISCPLRSQLREMEHGTAKFSFLAGLLGFCKYPFYLCFCSHRPLSGTVSPFPQDIQIFFHPLGPCSSPPPPGSLPDYQGAPFCWIPTMLLPMDLSAPESLTCWRLINSRRLNFSRAFASLPSRLPTPWAGAIDFISPGACSPRSLQDGQHLCYSFHSSQATGTFPPCSALFSHCEGEILTPIPHLPSQQCQEH